MPETSDNLMTRLGRVWCLLFHWRLAGCGCGGGYANVYVDSDGYLNIDDTTEESEGAP